MKIIFMGTPEFAVPALAALIKSEHKIAAVYTQPPRPAGRGYDLKKTPIHEYAEKHKFKVKTPETLKNKEAQQEFINLKAGVAVVSAYGLILPEEILKACKYGCINIHPSLLPRWRGSAPIQRAIMAGDKETGVCIMQMDSGLDTGAILMKKKIAMLKNITAGELHDTLAEISSELLLQTIGQLGNITPEPQRGETTYADKLSKDEEKINWKMNAEKIEATIRGLTPWPGAYFIFNGEKIKVISAEYNSKKISAQAGEVLDNRLTIACSQGTLRPIKIQKQGKNIMFVESFLNGTKIPAGTILN